MVLLLSTRYSSTLTKRKAIRECLMSAIGFISLFSRYPLQVCCCCFVLYFTFYLVMSLFFSFFAFHLMNYSFRCVGTTLPHLICPQIGWWLVLISPPAFGHCNESFVEFSVEAIPFLSQMGDCMQFYRNIYRINARLICVK